jgi:hypothetical protein
MKKLLPKISLMSLALLLTAGTILVSESGCGPKPACGNKRDHRKRKKHVKKFAPSMSYGSVQPTKAKTSVFI